MATTATPVDIFWAGINRNGHPLQFGVVTVTGIGTTGSYLYTTEDVAGAQTGATFTLDADGKAKVWGHGEYKFEIADKYGNPLSFSPLDHQTYRYLPATGSGLDATTLQGLSPRTNVVGSPTGVIPVGDDVRNPKLVADFISTIPSTHPADTLAASQLARMDIGNTLNGNQAIVAGETTLDNNKYYKGKSTGGSGHPLIGVNGSNVITVGDGSSGHILNLTGSTIKINGSPLLYPIATVQTKVVQQTITVTVGNEGEFDSGPLAFTPISAVFVISATESSGPATIVSWGSAKSATPGDNAYVADNDTSATGVIGVSPAPTPSTTMVITLFHSTGIKATMPGAHSGGATTVYKVICTITGYTV